MAIKARAVPLWETTRDLSDSREFTGAMTVLATKTPAYHTTLVGREIIWCACGTGATDGVFVYIDPDFWESLPNDYQRAFLLGHEVGHIVLAHMPRAKVFSLRGWLYKKLGIINHWNPGTYNQAADYIINADLVACGLEAIGGALLSPEYSRDDITEEVYIKLAEAEAEPEQPEQPDQPGEGSDTDPGEEAGDDAGDGSGDESGDESGDQDGESGDDAADESGESGDESDESGESGDQGDEAGDDEAGDTAGDESGEGGEPVPSNHGGHDQHLQPRYEGTEEEQEEAAAADIEDITRDIDTAIEQGELEGQHISGEMRANSSRYNDGEVNVLDTDWEEELSSKFNRSARSGKSTWNKIHRRRYNLLGVVTPSKIGGLNRLAIIKDISYSVSDQSERVFDAKVAELLNQIDVASGTIVLHTNTKVVHVDEVYSGDEYLDVEKLDGGGTTMSAGTDWLEEEGESPDVTLIFTDGEMSSYDFEKIGETDAIMVIDSPANYVYCKYYLEKYGIECVVINDAA